MVVKKGLLVVDVQSGMFNLPRPLYDADNLLKNISGLIQKARSEDIPIIYVQHCGKRKGIFERGSVTWQIHPAIAPKGNDVLIEKYNADSFHETTLEDELRKLFINQIVVCGLVTEGCVDTTIRRAYSLGFRIELASDCHSTTDSNILKAEQIILHHNEVLKIFAEVKEQGNISFTK